VLIVDTIFKAIEAAGQKVTATKAGVNAVIDGEGLVLEVAEVRERKEHEPTKSELKARAEWEG
jgi:apolipoprotein N-acyltransferase